MGLYKIPRIIGIGKKPSFGARVNPFHPLSQGLIGAWLCNEDGGSIIYDVIYGSGSTSAAGQFPLWKSNNLLFDGVNDKIIVPLKVNGGVENYYSIVWAITPKTARSYNNTIYQSNGDVWGIFAFQCDTGGAVYCGTTAASRFSPTELPAGTIEINKLNKLAFTNLNGTGYFYKNGVLLGSKACVNSNTWSFKTFSLGYSGGDTIDGELHYIFIYLRTLLDIEVASLHANPYQMFWNPMKDIYYAPAAAPPPTGGKSIFGYDNIFHSGGIIQT